MLCSKISAQVTALIKILSTSQQMKGDAQGHFKLFDKIKRTPTTTKSSTTSTTTASTTITINTSKRTITIYVQVLR